jgi:hypothetical protein
LNAFMNFSASACGIFRSTTMVIGALAVAPAADLTVAVAVNVSAPWKPAAETVVARTATAKRPACRSFGEGGPPRIC